MVTGNNGNVLEWIIKTILALFWWEWVSKKCHCFLGNDEIKCYHCFDGNDKGNDCTAFLGIVVGMAKGYVFVGLWKAMMALS